MFNVMVNVHPYIVALKNPLAHLGTHGHFTTKCPRTQGAAYYNFSTIIWYYSKMPSDIVSKI